MSKILVIADHDGIALNAATAKAVACAACIDGAEIEVAVFAESAAGIAAEAAALDSVTRVISIENAANKNLIAAVLAPQLVAIADGYSHIFGLSSTFGKDLSSACHQRSAKTSCHESLHCWVSTRSATS